ncbi:MAG: GNAT family N-acetyltransferase [Paracoccaceae bacterium]|nr:GNAT family N-acetyltransferase [Paracoccaceae bacterium]MDH5529984.1 GNAT family N-acetyltransferase [Paracoccaceae bacterium]
MVDHILDRPIWGSLTTRHACFAEGNGAARRFQADISRFAAMDEDDSDGMAALGALIASTGQIAVTQLSPVDCPARARQVHGFLVHQMLHRTTGGGVEDPELIRLGPADAEEMLALAILTKPGPFAIRTHMLGEYWGIRAGGKLVAMAGERLKLPGFTEISGVATHPDHRGRGHAGRLCRHVMARIAGRGETAFLHVETAKPAVEEYYAKLGFVTRQTLHVHLFEPA